MVGVQNICYDVYSFINSQPLLEETVNCLMHKQISDPITCVRLLCPGLNRESNHTSIKTLYLMLSRLKYNLISLHSFMIQLRRIVCMSSTCCLLCGTSLTDSYGCCSLCSLINSEGIFAGEEPILPFFLTVLVLK
jgi:hypothetical protein